MELLQGCALFKQITRVPIGYRHSRLMRNILIISQLQHHIGCERDRSAWAVRGRSSTPPWFVIGLAARLLLVSNTKREAAHAVVPESVSARRNLRRVNRFICKLSFVLPHSLMAKQYGRLAELLSDLLVHQGPSSDPWTLVSSPS